MTHFSETSSEEDTFEELSHPAEELVHEWTLQHVNLVDRPVDLHGDDKIGVVDRLEMKSGENY